MYKITRKTRAIEAILSNSTGTTRNIFMHIPYKLNKDPKDAEAGKRLSASPPCQPSCSRISVSNPPIRSCRVPQLRGQSVQPGLHLWVHICHGHAHLPGETPPQGAISSRMKKPWSCWQTGQRAGAWSPWWMWPQFRHIQPHWARETNSSPVSIS